MHRIAFIVFGLLAVIGVTSAHASMPVPAELSQVRSWSNKRGTITLVGRVVEMDSYYSFVLETSDGRRVPINAYENLSEKDLKFIQSLDRKEPVVPISDLRALAPLIPAPTGASPRRVIINDFPDAANRRMSYWAHLTWMLATYHKVEIKDLPRVIDVFSKPEDPPPAGTISALESFGFISRAQVAEEPLTPEVFQSQYLTSIRAALAAGFPPVVYLREGKNKNEERCTIAVGYDDDTSRVTLQAVENGRYEIGYAALAPKIRSVVDVRLPELTKIDPSALLEEITATLPVAPSHITQVMEQLQSKKVTFSLFLTHRNRSLGDMKTWALSKGPDILAAHIDRHGLVLLPQTPDRKEGEYHMPASTWVVLYRNPKVRNSYNARTLTGKGWGPVESVSAQRFTSTWPCVLTPGTADYDLPLILVGTPSVASAVTR